MNWNKLFLILIASIVVSACAGKRGAEHFYFGSYSEAEHLYSKGEYEEAISKYQMYIDENPEGNLAIISQYYIAKSYSALGNYQKAKELFTMIKDKYPDLVWANFSRTQLKELSESGSI